MGNICEFMNTEYSISNKNARTLTQESCNEMMLDSTEKIIPFLKNNNKDLFLHLSLGPYFNNNQAIRIAKLIKKNKFYTKIDLDIGMYTTLGSKLEDEGSMALVSSLFDLNEIIVLHLKFYVNYHLTNKTAENIAKLLNKRNCDNLSEFHLNFEYTKINNDGLNDIFIALSNKTKLKKLDIEIRNNHLKNKGIENLCFLLKENKSIEIINFCLEYNEISDIHNLIAILKKKNYQFNKVNLELSYNNGLNLESLQNQKFNEKFSFIF